MGLCVEPNYLVASRLLTLYSSRYPILCTHECYPLIKATLSAQQSSNTSHGLPDTSSPLYRLHISIATFDFPTAVGPAQRLVTFHVVDDPACVSPVITSTSGNEGEAVLNCTAWSNLWRGVRAGRVLVADERKCKNKCIRKSIWCGTRQTQALLGQLDMPQNIN